jgi:hypothetical protein
MRNVVSIGIVIGALAVAMLPARADDQAISFATGQIGGSPRSAQADIQQARASSRQLGAVQRAAPIPRVSSEAYAEFAQGGAYVHSCGPKNGSRTCR